MKTALKVQADVIFVLDDAYADSKCLEIIGNAFENNKLKKDDVVLFRTSVIKQDKISMAHRRILKKFFLALKNRL